jgi:hypothetical protein
MTFQPLNTSLHKGWGDRFLLKMGVRYEAAPILLVRCKLLLSKPSCAQEAIDSFTAISPQC